MRRLLRCGVLRAPRAASPAPDRAAASPAGRPARAPSSTAQPRALLASALAAVLLGAGCGGRSAAGWADEVPAAAPAAAAPVRLAEGEPPPPFSLQTSDGEVIESRDVIGARPLLIVFFTTWCGVCRRTMPEVRQVLELLESTPPASATPGDDTLTVLVSLDGAETWPRVPAYLAGYALDEPVVRGAMHEPFVMDYDPTLGIPMAIVVGRDGNVVDIQRGWSPVGGRRLRAALELARAAPAAAGTTRRSTSAP
jgi:cytochrome oxidase Cu insertion factor (SCO1/SenC/PrrC family)